jgi:hypothetical protein
MESGFGGVVVAGGWRICMIPRLTISDLWKIECPPSDSTGEASWHLSEMNIHQAYVTE